MPGGVPKVFRKNSKGSDLSWRGLSDGEIQRIFSCKAEQLFELEDSAAYNLVVDLDVHAIPADSERTRVQVVNVLAAINSKV